MREKPPDREAACSRNGPDDSHELYADLADTHEPGVFQGHGLADGVARGRSPAARAAGGHAAARAKAVAARLPG